MHTGTRATDQGCLQGRGSTHSGELHTSRSYQPGNSMVRGGHKPGAWRVVPRPPLSPPAAHHHGHLSRALGGGHRDTPCPHAVTPLGPSPSPLFGLPPGVSIQPTQPAVPAGTQGPREPDPRAAPSLSSPTSTQLGHEGGFCPAHPTSPSGVERHRPMVRALQWASGLQATACPPDSSCGRCNGTPAATQAP